MTFIARLVLLTVAALALVVAGGCGGSDTKKSNDYIKEINKVQQDFATNVQKVGSSSSAGSDPLAAAQKTFADLKMAIDKAISDLKAVEPPDKVKDLHAQLVGEMDEFATEVKAAGDSLKSKDPQKILQAQSKFATDAGSIETKVTQTIDQINTKLRD
jgi:hypothetical protein